MEFFRNIGVQEPSGPCSDPKTEESELIGGGTEIEMFHQFAKKVFRTHYRTQELSCADMCDPQSIPLKLKSIAGSHLEFVISMQFRGPSFGSGVTTSKKRKVS